MFWILGQGQHIRLRNIKTLKKGVQNLFKIVPQFRLWKDVVIVLIETTNVHQ
jgi:hypothetical protein